MNKVDGIIFDLDGTLWSTIDSCVKVLGEIKSKYPEVTKEINREEVEKSMGKSFDEIVKDYYGYIESFLRTSGLSNYFLDFECNGRTKLSKGENIELIIKRNNLKNAIYVGDTMGDKEVARYAKVPFVYASYGFGEVDEYDYIINSISDLGELYG